MRGNSPQAETKVINNPKPKSYLMKIRIAVLITMAAAAWTCQAQPATPAQCGFAAVTDTFYVNTNAAWYNGNAEHPGVDIAANGNILFGWEDDGSGINDHEAVWTLHDATGNPITPLTLQTNRSLLGNCSTYESTTNPWLSFFRDDNTAIGGYTGWGGSWPHANRFGNGLSWGAMCWEIGLEISELSALNTAINGDDTATVQLLNNDGTPLRPGVIDGMTNLGILSFTIADATPAGQIRGGESVYLSSGNIATVGRSGQNDDWILTGQTSGNVPVYRVWTPGGLEVKGYTAASSEANGGSIYRGLGVTANGFAIHWGADGNAPTNGSTIRLFNNAGNPLSANINLATLTGHPEVAGGGDGGGAGFHGNAVDAYVWANNGGGTPWVTVINADGTLRWSRKVQDESDPISNGGASADVDAAIDQFGRVIVVFNAASATNFEVVSYTTQARFFDKSGNPLGPRFIVSETESQLGVAGNAILTQTPRVAWRGNNVVVAWQSAYAPTASPSTALAARILAAPITITSTSRSGTSTTINWSGGKAPYSLQRRSPLTGAWGTVQTGIAGNTTTYTDASGPAYYQVLCAQ